MSQNIRFNFKKRVEFETSKLKISTLFVQKKKINKEEFKLKASAFVDRLKKKLSNITYSVSTSQDDFDLYFEVNLPPIDTDDWVEVIEDAVLDPTEVDIFNEKPKEEAENEISFWSEPNAADDETMQPTSNNIPPEKKQTEHYFSENDDFFITQN